MPDSRTFGASRHTVSFRMIIERALFAADYTPDLAWRLCTWCMELGAQEFALEIFGTTAPGASAYDELTRSLRPFALPGALRERLVAPAGQHFVRETKLWTLTPRSLDALRSKFPCGPFEYPFGAPAWCEDLSLYRDGALLLGIVSHEDRGLLRVTEPELARLMEDGFPTRESRVPRR